jgi:hypothetical protein
MASQHQLPREEPDVLADLFRSIIIDGTCAPVRSITINGACTSPSCGSHLAPAS